MFRKEYAFTEYKGIDWDERIATFRPRFEEAEANNDVFAYRMALRDLMFTIPDGHVTGPFNSIAQVFLQETDGGIGYALRQLDDGRVIANFILPDGPADQAGIELGAEIIAIDGVPIEDALSAIQPWSGPFSTDHVLRLQQLRYVTRAPLDTVVEVTYRNPDDDAETTVSLTTVYENTSFNFSSFNIGTSGFELPLSYELLPSGYAYVKIYSFFDNARLTIDLWERLMRTLNDNGTEGLIIDMRQNGGGSGFLADQMAAYFFDEPHILGNTGYYDEDLDAFHFDARGQDRFYLPPEDLRYRGNVAVLVGPNCNSACEFFSYVMTIEDRAAIVGQYPTAGLGGSIKPYYMPAGEVLQFTIGRAVDANGEIHIEGIGVIPTVQVPVTEETLFAEGDVILQAAIDHLDEASGFKAIEGDTVQVGDVVIGTINAGERVQHAFTFPADRLISIFLSSESGGLDTYLRIYDLYGNLLLDNDDANGTDSALEALEVGAVRLEAILEVGTFNDVGTGEYRLEIVDVTDEFTEAEATEEAETTPEATEEAEATPEVEATAEVEVTEEATEEPEATAEAGDA
jgi:C-terminal processing protease CtpA/Prc